MNDCCNRELQVMLDQLDIELEYNRGGFILKDCPICGYRLRIEVERR